ncbi:MAG: hypothetical protein F4Y03_09385 [Alphaproteobacteria bacterium]|nr:hypothetical protein [Alphaproteobacteria bacterium]
MAERNTPRRTGMIDYVEAYDVAASTKMEAGKIAALNTSGDAKEYAPAAAGSAGDEIVVGRIEETVDNSNGSAGDLKVRVRIGVFRWNNDTTGKVATKAHIGDAVYGTDSETIQTDAQIQAGGAAEATKVGRLVAVDSDGAWVATGIPFLY